MSALSSNLHEKNELVARPAARLLTAVSWSSGVAGSLVSGEPSGESIFSVSMGLVGLCETLVLAMDSSTSCSTTLLSTEKDYLFIDEMLFSF